MKTLVDPHQALSQGLAEIRTRFKVPDAFPPEVLAAAEASAQRRPTAHVDRTERAFVTLDPAASIDLDQAFAIEARGWKSSSKNEPPTYSDDSCSAIAVPAPARTRRPAPP